MKIIISLFLSIVVFAASAQNKITYIKMQRTACFGRCPEYTLELFKNGQIIYTGKKNVEKIGTFKGKVTMMQINKFLKQISKYKLLTLKPTYKAIAADLPRLNFTFTVNGKTKTVKNGESGPAYLALIGKKTDSLLTLVKWIEVNEADEAGGPVLNMNLDKDKKVTVVPEEQAQFPGGEAAMILFLSRNLKYPKLALESNIEGEVICTFTIAKNGKIKNIAVVKSMGYGCDEEAIRVIKTMPDWKPGKQNGKTVDTEFTLPVNFNLND